jgi:uncharacterized RDD family membrane protein YckC
MKGPEHPTAEIELALVDAAAATCRNKGQAERHYRKNLAHLSILPAAARFPKSAFPVRRGWAFLAAVRVYNTDMSKDGPPRIDLSIDVKPHAYDPVAQPELFEGVLPRRIVAFVIDIVLILAPVALVAMFIVLFGLVTFGFGWLLFWFLFPGTIVWALFYYGWTFASPASATIGMRTMDLEMRTWYGAPCYFVLGAVHAILFWLAMRAYLTPFVLGAALFNSRRRLLHDMLVGTVVINNESRAAALRATRT